MHAGKAGHAVGQAKEGGNGRNVPDVLVVKAVWVKGFVVCVVDLVAVQTDLHRKVQHGALARADVGFAVVDGHLVGNQRLLFVDAQDCAMGHHTIKALVGRAGRGDYHLALTLGQAAFFLEHQRIVIGKKGSPLRGAARKGQKHIGNEAGLFLNCSDALLDVFGQMVQVGEGIAVFHSICLLALVSDSCAASMAWMSALKLTQALQMLHMLEIPQARLCLIHMIGRVGFSSGLVCEGEGRLLPDNACH